MRAKLKSGSKMVQTVVGVNAPKSTKIKLLALCYGRCCTGEDCLSD